ncbi:transcription initiation factor TFIID subunit 10 [Planococcus citri]|uniref:transcription initiation factor TFIID subunit 10 n=1 Tax=Planococcus citri TaxID=170843 RepID=UPI0031F85965
MTNLDGEKSSDITNKDTKEKVEEETPIIEPIINLLQQLEDYSPTIPDAVMTSYLQQSGFDASDPRITRIIALAAQKFISDIANDALQQCKIRTSNQVSKGKPKDRRYHLTLEDLAPSLAEYGIVVRKPPYFV